VTVSGCTTIPVASQPATNAPVPSVSADPTPAVDPTYNFDTGPQIVGIPGYIYDQAPDELKLGEFPSSGQGDAAGVIVEDSKGASIATMVLFQYSPKFAKFLDRSGPDKILNIYVDKMRAGLAGKKVTVSSLQILTGTPVRMIQADKFSIVFAYRAGGTVLEVTGPPPAPVKFMRDYLTFTAPLRSS
jgi:hypothetical protein